MIQFNSSLFNILIGVGIHPEDWLEKCHHTDTYKYIWVAVVGGGVSDKYHEDIDIFWEKAAKRWKRMTK